MALKALLRNGNWLTRTRIKLWAGAFLVGFVLAVMWLILTAHGLSDAMGRPLGTDFSDDYAAGKLALAGHAADAYDFVKHYARERMIFGAATPFYGWHYPPFFLLITAPLAMLPYMGALALWLGVGLALYLLTLRRLIADVPALKTERMWWLAAIAFPAVFVNLTHGQNGFFTTALFAAGLSWLEKKPWLAGLCFGLVCYKPQFAVLLPFALAVGKHWKALAGFAVGLAGLSAGATASFGAPVWQAFLASTRFSREIVLEQGATGFQKIQSLFAAIRHLGGTVEIAYACQIVASLTAAVLLLILWRRQVRPALCGAGLCLATLLVTPYVLDYDFVLLAPALLLLVADGRKTGFRPYEKTLLAFLWFVPVVARTVAGIAYVPIGFLTVAAAFAMVWQRARETASETQPGNPLA